MTACRLLLYAAAVLFFCCVGALAEPVKLEDVSRRGIALHDAGRSEEALAYLRDAVELSEEQFGPSHSTTAKHLSNLGGVLVHLGQFDEAEQLLKPALKIMEETREQQGLGVILPLMNLAALYLLQNRYDEAETLYKRVLEIEEEKLGKGHPDVAFTVSQIGALYAKQQRFSEAEELYKRALAIEEEAREQQYPRVTTILGQLALIYVAQERYEEAEGLYKQALAIEEKELGRDHAEVMARLENLAEIYKLQSRYSDIEPLLKRLLRSRERTFGPVDLAVADTLRNLAALYSQQGRFMDAEPHLMRALSIREKSLPADDLNIVESHRDLGNLYLRQGRYAEAEPNFNQALAIREKVLRSDHPDIADSLFQLSLSYFHQARFAEAKAHLERILAIREKVLAPNDPDLAAVRASLGVVHLQQGSFYEAEAHLQEALAIRERIQGPEGPEVADSHNDLGLLYLEQGRISEAERRLQRALKIRRKILVADHADVAKSYNDLGQLYLEQERFAEAEENLKNALAMREEKLGPVHPNVGTTLSVLGSLYYRLGRLEESATLLRRSLKIREETVGERHPDFARALNNLGAVYFSQERYDEAEGLIKRAIGIYEEAFSEDLFMLAHSLTNLASLYALRDRPLLAVPLLKRSLSLHEEAFGQYHPNVASDLDALSHAYLAIGRFEPAGPLSKRSLNILETAYGMNDSKITTALVNLSHYYVMLGQYGEALDFIRRSTDILRMQTARVRDDKSTSELQFQISVRERFLSHVGIIWAAIEKQHADRKTLTSEAFEVGQFAMVSGIARAVTLVSARLATGNDDVANLIRFRQDSIEQWEKIDKELIQAVSKAPLERDPAAEGQLRARLEELDRYLDELDEELIRAFPRYAELAGFQEVSMKETQDLLNSNEALLMYLVTAGRAYLWVVRSDEGEMLQLEIGANELAKTVAELRAGLDLGVEKDHPEVPVFDRQGAFRLYEAVFAPAERLLEGVEHVFVVPDGALTSLPLGVLITDPPGNKGYEEVSWLARSYAFSVLPAVSSLLGLRGHAGPSKAAKPFVGFGDPAVGTTGRARRVVAETLFSSGAVANVGELRALAPLPESAVELYAISSVLKANPRRVVFLRDDAREGRLRAMDLSQFRVIAFATHGLVAGQFKGAAEPGLVLTPPGEASPEEDGFLASSEVAQLKLNADWVILSACNTASPDGTPGAEGLSGLAKAFFYAGARSLLVSHWEVDSEAAVRLTTVTLAESERPGVSRAEALRRAMLKLIGCDLRLVMASDGNVEDKIIRKFKKEFKPKKNECAVLIVRATRDSERFAIAGFNDAGEFRTVVIDDTSHKLSEELKKEPINHRRVVALATSSIGRTELPYGEIEPRYSHPGFWAPFVVVGEVAGQENNLTD